MKVMTIGIKSEKDAMKEFGQAFEAAHNRTPFKPVKGTYFTSLEAVRNFLTPKRLALVHIIKEKSPKSIYWLAKLAERSFPSVLKDVNVLSKHGLITLTKEKESPRHTVHPSVNYSAINLWISL
jgi:predicted transcriptional regulator